MPQQATAARPAATMVAAADPAVAPAVTTSTAAATASLPSASTGPARPAETNATAVAGQATAGFAPPGSSVRVEWQTAAGRGARPGEPGAVESAEPGRTAARLIETLRASRMASTSDAAPETGGASSFAAALAAASPPASAPMAAPLPQDASATPAPVQLSNPWPLEDPAFAQHLAAQVQETLLGGIERAEISVTPPSMGPIRIELSLSGEQASVAFSAAMPETCRAIEQSLPMLETMLSNHGLALADATVNAGGTPGSSPEHGRNGHPAWRETGGEAGGDHGRERPRGDPPGALAAGEPPTDHPRGAARGLLDLFA
jgi:flagellar hook-length control protein FliK